MRERDYHKLTKLVVFVFTDRASVNIFPLCRGYLCEVLRVAERWRVLLPLQ
jgi:hypothetical protein